MRGIIYLTAFLLAVGSCSSFSVPAGIPLGKWDYKLFVNGIDAGSAEISSEKRDGTYVSSSQFNMEIGGVSTISRESVTETLGFKPVALESYSKITSGGSVHENMIKASFAGSRADIVTNNTRASYEIKGPFVLDGNYFYAKLMEGRFTEGLEAQARVYHPSIELESPVAVRARVAGISEAEINGKKERLLRISQSIEGIKSIDVFIGSDGVTRKVLIQMLNLKIELIKV